MKKNSAKLTFFCSTIALCLFLTQETTAQVDDKDADVQVEVEGSLEDLSPLADPLSFQNALAGNFGWINIDGDNHIGFRLQPEFTIGKVGIGVDVPLYYNVSKGALRAELYNDGIAEAILRTIRYVRYGRKKRDKVYARVGDLTGAYIGYGLLLNNYSNTYSEEKRKIGVEFDIRFNELVGLEALYSDIAGGSFNLLAVRPYFRPFGRTDIPIIKTVEIGGTFISDRDQTENFYEPATTQYNSFLSKGIISFGADFGVTFVRNSFLTVLASAQYGRINAISGNTAFDTFLTSIPNQASAANYGAGDGISVGAVANFRLIADVFSLGIKIDRVWYSNNFIPQFFDTSYEIDKDTRISSLAIAEKKGGIYGTISGQIINTIIISGSLVIPDQISENNPAALRIAANIDNLGDKFIVRGYYYKGNLSSLSDAFDPDNAVANLRLGYRFNKLFVGGVDYYRTFVRLSDGSYGSTDQVMPYIGINIRLGDSTDKEEY